MKFLLDYFNSGSARQQNKKRFAAMLICITAVLLAVALIALTIGAIATAIKNKAPSNDDEGADGTGTKIPAGYTTTTFDATQLSSGNLLLIDGSHPYTGNTNAVLFDTHESRAKDENGASIYTIGGRYDLAATEETVRAFNAMIAAFYADEKAGGDNNLYIFGAYNINAANQASELYATGTVIALRYYVDYNADPTNIQTISGVEKYKWIYDNAYKYGFVQASDAVGDENVFRYVGVAHSTYMKNNNKTISEYLELLQTRTTVSRPLSVTVSDAEGKSVKYNMYYLTSTEEAVVPSKYTYTVSGDNMGGYIVTVNTSSATTAK